jgi:fructose-specific phosphotransferase system IIC component
LDPFEKWPRFLCGTLLGLIVGLYFAATFLYDQPVLVVASLGIAAVVCGLLVVRYGVLIATHALRGFEWMMRLLWP